MIPAILMPSWLDAGMSVVVGNNECLVLHNTKGDLWRVYDRASESLRDVPITDLYFADNAKVMNRVGTLFSQPSPGLPYWDENSSRFMITSPFAKEKVVFQPKDQCSTPSLFTFPWIEETPTDEGEARQSLLKTLAYLLSIPWSTAYGEPPEGLPPFSGFALCRILTAHLDGATIQVYEIHGLSAFPATFWQGQWYTGGILSHVRLWALWMAYATRK